MTVLYILAFLLLSYFLGSIPSGLVIGKLCKGIDIREHGSKNTGATNTIRVLGFRYGIFAFLFDAFKGGLVMLILVTFELEDFYLLTVGDTTLDTLVLYGLAAVVGHVFPIYIGFKGGKAVATSAGVVIALEPFAGFVTLAIFLFMVKKTRYVSLASTVAALSVMIMFTLRIIIAAFGLFRSGEMGFFFVREADSAWTFVLELLTINLMALLIFIRHRMNYKRLRDGTEFQV
ncbi:MAG: glycerol-3-phosphate 1-O-acyltransferase PlsY [Acholeplasmataceae bacterium]